MPGHEPLPTTPIALDPADWYRATWRPLAPLPRPAEVPFDLADRLERLQRITRHGVRDWDRAGISVALSIPEARFWLEAMAPESLFRQPEDIARQLGTSFEGSPLGRDEVLTRLASNPGCVPPHVVLPLARLLTIEELATLATGCELADAARGSWTVKHSVQEGIRRFLLPYLDAHEHAILQGQARSDLTDAQQRWGQPDPPEVAFAAALGLHEEMLRIVRAWPDGHFRHRRHANWNAPTIVLGLGSAELVCHHMLRLGLVLLSSAHARAWLAHTELEGLEMLHDSILAAPRKDAARDLAVVLALVQSPQAAPWMLALHKAGKATPVVGKWLEEDPMRTAQGLAASAAGRGKLASAAIEFLEGMSRSGHTDAIEVSLAALEPGQAERVRRSLAARRGPVVASCNDMTTPPWLTEAVQEQQGSKPASPPRWLPVERLPPVRVGAICLNPNQVQAALRALRESSLERPRPLVRLLKEHADPLSLDAFAWEVCQRWLGEGAPSQERWALTAVGLWGGDAAALKLAPLVRAWPSQGQHRRAGHGLEALCAIGTDSALLALAGIARERRQGRLQQTALGYLHDIASRRRLSPAQLEDRIVPDLGLDRNATRVFDLGARQFTLVLGRDLKPMLRDPEGRVRSDLPRGRVTDDPVRTAATVEQWKVLRRQLRDILKVQASRLETALVNGRRWTVEEFEKHLLGHPVLGLLAQTLLWGGVGLRDRPVHPFRVTEDRTVVDLEEQPVSLADCSAVCLVHPLQLSLDERQAWRQTYADHDIVQPFSQLGREVFALHPEEESSQVLHRHRGARLPAATLAGTLEKLGYERARLAERLDLPFRVTAYLRYFAAADLTAVVCFHPGIPAVGFPTGQEDQTLDASFLLPGLPDLARGPSAERAVVMGQADPVVVNELLSAIETLKRKAL